ncbi:MAG: hypothetical protein K2H87_00895, partial [Duncaniella sp.]|nr:hypothetical protein [Duncaniella sp.]
YRYTASGHHQIANMLFSAIIGTYTYPGDGDGNNPAGGETTDPEIPDDLDYYTIVEYVGERNGTCIDPQKNDPWWAYNEMGISNIPFTLEGCDTETLYLEFDMYVETPGVAAGDPAFPGIVWGKILPSDAAHGNQPQNYFFVKMKKPATATTERLEWNFTNMSEQMNDVFGAMLSEVKSGQWNHMVIPFKDSPFIDQLPLDGGYTTAGVSFARMQKNNYVFKTKNAKLVDRSRYYQNTVVETGYNFVQPGNIGDEATFTLGGPAKTYAFMRLDFNMPVEVTDPANTSFCFDVEISSLDGNDDPALLGNITGAGGQGIFLASCTANEIQSASSKASNYNIKKLDWQFGKHTYILPLSSFTLNGGMTWEAAPIASCWMYLYDDVLTLDKINMTFSNFNFVKRELVDADDTTSLEEVEFVTESEDNTVTIYNLCGIPVFKGAYTDAQLPSGVYVVVGANGARKVLL